MSNLSAQLIWIIRQYEPIAFGRLVQVLNDDYTSLPGGIRDFADRYFNFAAPTHKNMLQEQIHRLLASGLITVSIEGFSPYEDKIEDSLELKSSPTVDTVLKTFDLSLSKLVDQPKKPFIAFPDFEEPLMRGDWADVFVIMPFRTELSHIFDSHILPVAHELGLSCKRGDDFTSDNAVMREVWTSIVNCKICIAECTGQNPNVFYELGIAHTVGRETLLLAQAEADIPFDIRHKRFIIYKDNDKGLETLRNKLQTALKQISEIPSWRHKLKNGNQ